MSGGNIHGTDRVELGVIVLMSVAGLFLAGAAVALILLSMHPGATWALVESLMP